MLSYQTFSSSEMLVFNYEWIWYPHEEKMYGMPRRGGNGYSGSITDLVTLAGGLSSIHSNSASIINPIINKHWGKPFPKYGFLSGLIGNTGDLAATGGAIYNLIVFPQNPESYFDMSVATLGWLPFYGDVNAIYYMGAKSQIYIIQKNIINNENPLKGVYNPQSGEVMW